MPRPRTPRSCPKRVNVRLPEDMQHWITSESRRRGGPLDARGNGEGYSDIVREGLELVRTSGLSKEEWQVVRLLRSMMRKGNGHAQDH